MSEWGPLKMFFSIKKEEKWQKGSKLTFSVPWKFIKDGYNHGVYHCNKCWLSVKANKFLTF